MNDDERNLLLRVHKGDDAAARELWSRHGRAMLAHARTITISGADDVVQRALCRILDLRRDQLAAVRDVPAFLATLVRREALNWLRGEARERARRKAGTKPAEVVLPKARAGSDLWSGTESDVARSIAAAVNSLPRRLREVVVLRHVAGLTFDQLALALSANRSTVASRYHDAVARLRQQLGQHLGDESRPRAGGSRVQESRAEESTEVSCAKL